MCSLISIFSLEFIDYIKISRKLALSYHSDQFFLILSSAIFNELTGILCDKSLPLKSAKVEETSKAF